MTKYMAGSVVEEVHLAPRVHRHYRAIAERNGCSVVDLLSEALRRIATAHPDLQSQPAPSVEVAAKEWLITVRRWRPEHDEVLRTAHANGDTDPAIARSIGCSTQLVFQHRKLLGLPANAQFPKDRRR